jgi:hypothetical protein
MSMYHGESKHVKKSSKVIIYHVYVSWRQDSDNSGYSDNVQRFDYICDSCTFSMLKHVKLDKNKDLRI